MNAEEGETVTAASIAGSTPREQDDAFKGQNGTEISNHVCPTALRRFSDRGAG
jgi:hypothetical protein